MGQKDGDAEVLTMPEEIDSLAESPAYQGLAQEERQALVDDVEAPNRAQTAEVTSANSKRGGATRRSSTSIQRQRHL